MAEGRRQCRTTGAGRAAGADCPEESTGEATNRSRIPERTNSRVGQVRLVVQNQCATAMRTPHWMPEQMTSRTTKATESTMKSLNPTVRPVT